MLSAAANDVELSSFCSSGSGLPGLSALRRASAEEAPGQAGEAASEEINVFTGDTTARSLLSLTAVGQDEHGYLKHSQTGSNPASGPSLHHKQPRKQQGRATFEAVLWRPVVGHC